MKSNPLKEHLKIDERQKWLKKYVSWLMLKIDNKIKFLKLNFL